MELATAVGGEDDDGCDRSGEGAELGNRHRRLAEELEQHGFELVVGPIDLVDQQDRSDRPGVSYALQDRSFEEELLGEQIGLLEAGAVRLAQPNGQQLALVVPLVERFARGESLVALEAYERCAHGGRHRLGGRGLAHAGLAFEQEGLPQRRREVQRGGEALVGQVVDGIERAERRPRRRRARS